MKNNYAFFSDIARLRRGASRSALWSTLSGAILLAGCATPMDARKDAPFHAQAYTMDRPVVRPTRALTSFSESLSCMDRMLRESQIPTTLITSKQIPDFSAKVPAAAKDMIVTSLSQMSRLSHAFRYVDYEVDISRQDTVQNLTTILLNNNQMQLQRPALYVSGAIAYVDQGVISNRFDAGTSAARLDTGYSQSRNATVLGLELHLGDFRTRTLIPGLDSANEVIIGGAGQGLDLAGRIGDYGVKFNVGRDYALGTGGALRTLIDLAMIEMVGKWARVPYWQCLTLEQTHPDFQRQMLDWYQEGSPLVHNKLVQRSLISQGYLGANGTELAENSPEFVAALGRFQADKGMVVTGVVDFPTYERALRNFVALGADGKLAQVGWSTTDPAPVAVVPIAASASGTASVSYPVTAHAAYGAATGDRVIDMQIENVLVGRSAFEVGEQIFLSVSLTRSSYMYCFLHEAGGTVMRLLPNPTNPNALMSANQAIRIPDWMSPMPGFIMDATSAGTEHVACFATDNDVAANLPQYLKAPALAPLANVRDINSIKEAFNKSLGNGNYTVAQVQWNVVKKNEVAGAAPAAKK
jgi:Domain of unknown function (DUF4384)/Putative peptidoglycan binding domain